MADPVKKGLGEARDQIDAVVRLGDAARCAALGICPALNLPQHSAYESVAEGLSELLLVIGSKLRDAEEGLAELHDQ